MSPEAPQFTCPLPVQQYANIVLAHGAGGDLMHRLIDDALFRQPREDRSSYTRQGLLPMQDHLNAMEIRVDAASYESHKLTELQRYDRAGRNMQGRVLGLLKGLHEGMNRFSQSVGKVYEEQKRYNLPSLSVGLPPNVNEFSSIWQPFRKLVKDEKYMGRHPLEFSQKVKDFTAQHLTDAQIEAAFVEMGEALKRATKRWK